MNSPHTVVGFFANRNDADLGMTRLLTLGYTPEQVSLLEPAGGSESRIGVSAEVAGTERGTIAASVLLASRAVEVGCPIPELLRSAYPQTTPAEQAA